MKVFYLDCGGKATFTKHLINKIAKHDYDLIFLADAYNMMENIENCFPEYQFYNSKYKLGINILAKGKFSFMEIPHKTDHPLVDKKYTMDKYEERLFLVEYQNSKFLVVKAPKHKPYKQIFMVQVIEITRKINPDIIIGNFNTGYLEDALNTDDFKFTTGFIGFTSLENLGYNDYNKNNGEYSFETERGDLERIDHAFSNKPLVESKYIDMLSFGFDHKGIQIKL